MDLHVAFEGRTNLARQIYLQIRAAVLAGSLLAGETLPPSRELAARLGISRNTVSVAYDRLVAEGLLTTKTGAGTYVSAQPSPNGGGPDTPDPSGGSLRARPVWAGIPLPIDLSDAPAFDFRVGTPDARLFPYATWRGLVGKQLRASAVGSGMPGEPAGHLGLRTAIARHLRVSRNVRATPQDVLVTNGSNQAFDLIGRVLLEPGACVAVEAPGYPPPRLLFESLGARIVGVPVDNEGLIVDALPADARIVYVTPSHQLPLGMAMSQRRRAALLSWADRHDAAIIEDDYDTEFRYTDQPLEPLQSLDRSGRVLYVGSFSKVMLPTLRLGFLIVPAPLHHALQVAKFVSDWHTALPAQAALADFIDTGGFARHIRRMRNVYQARHQRIAAALAGPLSPWLEAIESAAGLHLGAFVTGATAERTQQLQAHARTSGVAFFDFDLFAPLPDTRPGLLLGYGAIPTNRIDEGLRLLRHSLATLP